MLSYLDLFFALYVFINALCAGFACAHCEDNGCSAGDCIAACENALASRCAAFVCLDAALTGEGQTLGGVADQREWVEAIVKKAREAGTAVFMKDSLKPIWGDNILREHPPGMIGGDNSG